LFFWLFCGTILFPSLAKRRIRLGAERDRGFKGSSMELRRKEEPKPEELELKKTMDLTNDKSESNMVSFSPIGLFDIISQDRKMRKQ